MGDAGRTRSGSRDARLRVWLYAIVAGAAGPLRGEGVAGERLSRVRVGGLDLVVGTAPAPSRPRAGILQRYDATIRRLMETHASVLPARFGTCAPTLEELSAAVLDRRPALRRALRAVRHRVQMTIRVLKPKPGSDRGRTRIGPGSDPGPTPVRPRQKGRQFLRQRAAELQILGADGVHDAVRKWIRAERIERYERGRLAGTMYHLVPRNAAPAYRRALERFASGASFGIVIGGPWPPYAFAEDVW